MEFRVYTIDGVKPINWQSLHGHSRWGGKYLTKEAREYKDRIRIKLAETDGKAGPIKGKWLALRVIFFIPKSRLISKRGVPKRVHDLTGLFRGLEDAISEYTGIDDSRNVYTEVHKVISPDDMWHIKIIQWATDIESGDVSNWTSIPMAELARIQGIQATDDLDQISKLLPADDDPDKMLAHILDERSARRKLVRGG